MSGGRLNYIEFKIEECAEAIRTQAREDYLLVALAGHLDELKEILHAVEWHLSNDASLQPEDREKISAFIGQGKELDYAIKDAVRVREELTRLIKKADSP